MYCILSFVGVLFIIVNFYMSYTHLNEYREKENKEDKEYELNWNNFCDKELETQIKKKLSNDEGLRKSIDYFNNELSKIEGIDGAKIPYRLSRKKENIDRKNILLLFEMSSFGKLPDTFNSKEMDSFLLRCNLDRVIKDSAVIDFFKTIEDNLNKKNDVKVKLICNYKNNIPISWTLSFI